MKKRWIYLLAALALVVSTCIAEPLAGIAAKLEADGNGYVAGSCSLTVHPENLNRGGAEGFGEDLAGADVVVDLYRIARAVKTPGYDSYQYEFLSGYDLNASENTGDNAQDQVSENIDWEEVAQHAAGIVLNADAPVAPVVKGAAVNAEISDLEPGLYLIVARGSKMTEIPDYKKETKQKDPLTQEENIRIATIANSELHSYAFLPQLVSLPTKPADENGVINTANPGEWAFSMEVNLKPEQLSRYGSLRIIKTLTEYETMGGTQESATFVFEITGRLNNEVVYSNVEAITFTAAGEESITVSRIPAGAEVTVTEVYSGSSYRLTVPGDRTATITADAVVSVEFENEYDGRRTNGHGINNQFVYDEEEGTWNWYSSPIQSAPGNMGEAGGQNTSGSQTAAGNQDGAGEQTVPDNQEEPGNQGNSSADRNG